MEVAIVIPAHNEQDTISKAVYDLVFQTYQVKYIIVINDCSTDNTAEVLKSLTDQIPQLVVLTNYQPKLRAGAINCGLEYLKRNPVDIVIASDADSRFDFRLVEEATKCFKRNNRIGGVCSTSGVIKPIFSGSILKRIVAWFLWHIQRLDCSGFDVTRTSTISNVHILHGLCSAFRYEALMEVGGYSSSHMLEDYDLTLKIKKAGWKAVFCPTMKAWTNVPLTFRSFFRQRRRWMRGGMDIILQHGLSKYTAEDMFNHFLFLALLFSVMSFTVINIILNCTWKFSFYFHPLPFVLFAICYVWSIYKMTFLNDLNFGDVIIRISIMPELIMAITLSFIQISAYYLSIFKRPQRW
jgi:biofilm PGA synthesis N-glycosyltransferase PgaC